MKNGWKKQNKHGVISSQFIFGDLFNDVSVSYCYVDERKQRSTFARMGRNGKDIMA